MILVGALVLLVWIGLAATGFWRTSERDENAPAVTPAAWPDVVAIIPARDEAEVIARSIGSLAAQDYPGPFRIILVDDHSSDGTAAAARALESDRLTIVAAPPLPAGWTGKLWAMSQGVAASGGATLLWLTDADIEHAPDTLRMLVGIAESGDRRLVSLMAKLRCQSLPERAIVPAFVFFFQLLYPFARVNRPGKVAAAAGGCMLVRHDALEKGGGIAAIRDALIDDCALGALMKRRGPIWLGLTTRSRSIRPYERWSDVAAMIARSAYAQLGYSPLNLVSTVTGLAFVFLTPLLLALLGSGTARLAGSLAWLLMAALFQPMLRFYRRSPAWGLALPAIAMFYGACTVLSAWRHHRGRGGMWKGRVQAAVGR